MTEKENLEGLMLYVNDHPTRVQILGYLYPLQYSQSIADIAKAIYEKKGNVNFHCRGLEHQGLLQSIKVPRSRKLFFRTTDTGKRVFDKLEAEHGDNT